MKYNKRYVEFDENGVAHPVRTGEYDGYDTAYYHTAIQNIITSNDFEEFSFELNSDHKDYIVTIPRKSIKITREKKIRDDGKHFWMTWVEFEDGGYFVEFLAFFEDAEIDSYPELKFVEINTDK